MNRWSLFIAGLALSIALTVGLWAAGYPGFFLFLAVPFFLIPWSRQDRPTARCPACGYQARAADEAYCPRDGSRLA